MLYKHLGDFTFRIRAAFRNKQKKGVMVFSKRPKQLVTLYLHYANVNKGFWEVKKLKKGKYMCQLKVTQGAGFSFAYLFSKLVSQISF